MKNNPTVNKAFGYIFLLSGLINVSWQLLFLRIIQGVDYFTTGGMSVSILQYAGDFTYVVAFLISVAVIVTGIVLLKQASKERE